MVYGKVKSFRICTYKKHGGHIPSSQRFFSLPHRARRSQRLVKRERVTSHSVRPIAEQALWCNNLQRHGISSRSEETTPLSSVSNTNERTSGTARFWSPSQVVPGPNVL